LFSFTFSSRGGGGGGGGGGVHAACRGDSRVYTRAGFTLHACTRGLSLDNPRVPRADLFEVDAHPKNKLNAKMEVLNS
jgi:hypothetical protein